MGAEDHPLAARLHAASWGHNVTPNPGSPSGGYTWNLVATEPTGYFASLTGQTLEADMAEAFLALIVAEHEAATAPKTTRTRRRVYVARALSLLLLVCLLLAIWVGDGRWFATGLLVAVMLSVACAPQWAESKAAVEAQKAAKATGS